jgi:hypothetical protein
MPEKIMSPAAINALKEALIHVYWYKKDLGSFLHNTLADPRLLSQFDWVHETKRDIVTRLVEHYARKQKDSKTCQDGLLNLMQEVMKTNDFSHLRRLEDGDVKEKAAREAVQALRNQAKDHFDLLEEQRQAEAKRKSYVEKIERAVGVSGELEQIKRRYIEMINDDTNPQKRGFLLQDVLRKVFALFDLDPKASFRIEGEQIDGAFTFENIDYIVEAKWQKSPVDTAELDAFDGKVSRRVENTLGLYISISGFSEAAVKKHSHTRSLMILMDGSDLMAVLEARIILPDLLLRKRRHAALTGEIFLKISDILR